MWVKINKTYDHWTGPRRVVAFKEGTKVSVTRNVGEALIEKGVAEEIDAPPRAEIKQLAAEAKEKVKKERAKAQAPTDAEKEAINSDA